MTVIRSSVRIFLTIGLVALLAQSAFAHTYLSSLVLDGTALAEGDCVRPHPSSDPDSPITLVSSPNMTCGFLPQSAEAANRACPIAAGSSLGIQWHHNNDLATDDILDSSHKGPVIFYLAKSDTGADDVWFKIYEDGYTASDTQWATDRLIANDGLVTITIPSDIEPGNYLLRGEVLALHQAYELDGVQPYVGCAELAISGSGSANPSASGVAFPGAYSDTDPGILINIYTDFGTYTIPGPALYESGSSNTSSASSSSTSSSSGDSSSSGSSATGSVTSAPTPVPTSPTTKPSTTGSSSPSTGSSSGSSSLGSTLTVEMNQGSSAWWLGVIVSGGSQATSTVEIADSGSVSWTPLTVMSYAYVFSQSIQLTLPISVRLTSASGSQVTLTDVFTSWTPSLIDTGVDYGSDSTQETNTPTDAPADSTTAPTDAPSSSSSGSGPSSSSGASSSTVQVTVWSTASSWWFACTVSGVSADTIASVEAMDSTMTTYALMTNNGWGYSLQSNGAEFVAPITVRVTNEAGASVTASLPAITPNAVANANGSL